MPDTTVDLVRLQSSIDSISRWRTSTDEKLKELQHTVYGNGQPGMDEQIRDIYRIVKEMKEKDEAARMEAKKKDDESWSQWQKYLFWFVTFALSQLFTLWISGVI